MANPLDTIIGASKNFNAIVSNFEKIKKLVQDGKEDDIAAFVAKVEPELKAIESKIKGFFYVGVDKFSWVASWQSS